MEAQGDGKEIQSGELPLPALAPRATTEVTLPVKPFTPEPGVEYFLELSFHLKHATPCSKPATKSPGIEFKLPDSAPAPALGAKNLPPFDWNGDTQRNSRHRPGL